MTDHKHGTSPASMGLTIRTIRVSEVRAPMLERWGKHMMELERERGWLIELAAGITDIVHTGDTERVDEAWIAISDDLKAEIQDKETDHDGYDSYPRPLPYTAGRFGP